MKLIRSLDSLPPSFPGLGSSLTLGNFDGIHMGHQTLLLRTVEMAKAKNLVSVVVTYHPNPSIVLGKKPNFKYLSLEDEKETLINSFGIDYLLVLEFTETLSKMSAEDFLDQIIISKLNAKHIVIGYNHFFGSERRGDFSLLDSWKSKYGYTVELKEAVAENKTNISSSLIRNHLERGEMLEAQKLLGRFYNISGTIIEGQKRGRTIGFPTANLEIDPQKLLPSIGVYACLVNFNEKQYKGMVNIGVNPTFGGDSLHVEVNIFEFSGDLYGKKINLSLVEKIRDEKKFTNIDVLKDQLTLDKLKSIEILKLY